MNIPISDSARLLYCRGRPAVGDVEKVLESLNALHYVQSRSETIGLYTVRGTEMSKAEEIMLRIQEMEKASEKGTTV